MTGRRRVLVTGGSGFIGRHALPLLVDMGYEVHSVSRRPLQTSHADVIEHQADFLSKNEVESVLDRVRPTHLLHLAWNVTPGKFWSTLDNLDWCAASLNLFRAFSERGGQRMVTSGTCAEYDWKSDWLDEKSTPLLPHTLYGTSKNALRSILQSAAEQTDVSVAWGRIFFLYGPYEDEARLVPYVINSLLQSNSVECTDGRQERDFMHVKDVARAFAMLLTSDVEGEVNIASGECLPLRVIVESIADQMGAPRSLLRFGARSSPPGEPARLAANVERLRAEVGFLPELDLRAGILDTIEYWRSKAS